MNKLKEQVLTTLIENGNVDICHKYGEQGYNLEDSKKAILFGDLNKLDSYPNFCEWLEENYELEWSDEWIIDYNNSKAYRTQQNSYQWQKQFIVKDGELITPDNDIEDWIEACKVDSNSNINTQLNALPYFINTNELISRGFKIISDNLQSGFYGRNDNPIEIANELIKQSGYKEVLFSLSSVNQFRVDFEVYAR